MNLADYKLLSLELVVLTLKIEMNQAALWLAHH